MSALNMLGVGGSLRGATLCPHPERLRSAAIRIEASRPMVLCPDCKDSLEQLIAGWHAHRLDAGEVARAMLNHGYGRLDAARFVLQLVSDRFALRVGLLKEAEL